MKPGEPIESDCHETHANSLLHEFLCPPKLFLHTIQTSRLAIWRLFYFKTDPSQVAQAQSQGSHGLCKLIRRAKPMGTGQIRKPVPEPTLTARS